MTVFPPPPEGFDFAESEDDGGVMTAERLRFEEVATGEVLTFAEMVERGHLPPAESV